MKRHVTLLLLSIILIPVIAVRAVTVEELRKKIDERTSAIKALETEIAQYQQALEHQSGVSKSLKGEIGKLETQIKKLNSDITLTQYQIQKTEYSIEQLSLEVADKEHTISFDEKSLGELLRGIHENDELSLIEVLFAHNDLADFWTTTQSFETLSAGLDERVKSLEEKKNILISDRNQKTAEEDKLQSLKHDLSGRKTAQEQVNSTKKKLLLDSKNQETQYQKMVKEREQRRTLVQQELESIEEELKRTIDPSSIPGKKAGVLGWPTTDHIITQGFGFTEFAVTYGNDIYKGKGHNGVDFKASIGTPILAAADGIVKDFGNTDPVCPGGSYGKWVLLEHPNNLMTIYGHLSGVAVSRGQKVARGQTIAYSGATGYVTGPHLHFTVYAANTYRFAKTNHCGMVPAGGYLNPLDYLPSP